MSKDKRHLIVCNCGDCEHQAILFYSDYDDEKILFMHFHLRTWKGFFRRLWIGLRYAFGYNSRYGAWDEIIISEKEAVRIYEFLADIGYLDE